MANRIQHYTCQTCGELLAKHDLRNGAYVFRNRLFKIVEGSILLWCRSCKKYVGPGGNNPLSVPKLS